ncbi:hypothetical protein KCV01_g1008, partial [Aureobasidium melanogenum]
MSVHEFQLEGDYVELNILLKLTGIAGSGGEGKHLVAEGLVRVDGVQELRKTFKRGELRGADDADEHHREHPEAGGIAPDAYAQADDAQHAGHDAGRGQAEREQRRVVAAGGQHHGTEDGIPGQDQAGAADDAEQPGGRVVLGKKLDAEIDGKNDDSKNDEQQGHAITPLS